MTFAFGMEWSLRASGSNACFNLTFDRCRRQSVTRARLLVHNAWGILILTDECDLAARISKISRMNRFLPLAKGGIVAHDDIGIIPST